MLYSFLEFARILLVSYISQFIVFHSWLVLKVSDILYNKLKFSSFNSGRIMSQLSHALIVPI